MGERDHLIGLRGQSPGYAEDYAAWLAHQVALLQSGRFDALDMPNLVDEVESLGRSDFKTLVSAIEIVLIHMLKWDHQPKRRTRSWELSIAEHRRRIARELMDSPSYRHRLAEATERAWDSAPILAAKQTKLPLSDFPMENPYDWQAITGREHVLDA